MQSITLRRLEVFVAVAECGGFVPAAKRLDILTTHRQCPHDGA